MPPESSLEAPVCLYEWQARVNGKVNASSAYPKCAKANGGRLQDGTRLKHPTFANDKHPLLRQWHPELNEKEGKTRSGYKATSVSGGPVISVPKACLMSVRLLQTAERVARGQQGALIAPGVGLVTATPWRLCVLTLQLTLMFRQTL